jgi:hypothetical protein
MHGFILFGDPCIWAICRLFEKRSCQFRAFGAVLHAIRVRRMMRQAAAQAADAIRDAILAGRIPADARIAELDLTRRLSVSRTLIREALSRLRPRASSS